MGAQTQQKPTVYNTLMKFGPSTMAELGINSVCIETRRAHPDLKRLNMHVRGARARAVWYVDGAQDTADVVRKYFEVNPEVLDKPAHTVSQIFGDHSREMAEAWRSISGEYDLDSTNRGDQDHSRGGTCSLCDKKYDSTLPHHIRTDCDA